MAQSQKTKDFFDDDLSNLFNQADIVIGDFINGSLYNNLGPKLFLNLKSTYPHIKFIPDNFSYVGKIVEDQDLDKQIACGYADQKINSALDKIALSIMTLQPMKLKTKYYSLSNNNWHNLISYNFDDGTIQTQFLDLPYVKENQWLEVAAKVGDFEFYYLNCLASS